MQLRGKRGITTREYRVLARLYFDPLPHRFYYRSPVDVAKTWIRERGKGYGERTARNEKWEQKNEWVIKIHR